MELQVALGLAYFEMPEEGNLRVVPFYFSTPPILGPKWSPSINLRTWWVWCRVCSKSSLIPRFYLQYLIAFIFRDLRHFRGSLPAITHSSYRVIRMNYSLFRIVRSSLIIRAHIRQWKRNAPMT